MSLKLMYITNNPDVAIIAQKYGVDRIWVDLEVLGKEERQKNLDTVKSRHSVNDIKIISPQLSTSEMLVRVNPWNENSLREIDGVISAGAQLVMLPMWKTVKEVQSFIKAVGGRAKTVLLLETKAAAGIIDDVLRLTGIDEIHIGLNDLHLDYNLKFMFELLSDGTVERLCKKIAEAGIPYGFGGIAGIGEGALPAEKIILEHYRLGSTRAILSRSFCDYSKMQSLEQIESVLKNNICKLREFERFAQTADTAILSKNKREVKECVDAIVRKISERVDNG